jgi:cell division protein FtsQ
MNVQQLKALADALNRLSPEVLESLSEIIPGSTPDELIIFTREQYEILTTWENLAGNLAIYPNLVEALARESADGKPVKGQIYLKEAKWFVPYEEQKKDQADH